MKGIDYTDGSLRGVTIKADGYDFVGRYLSFSPWKTLTLEEVDQLHEAGIKIVVVWETTTQRSLDGYNAGVSDAQTAKSQAKSVGMPEDRPIYFAIDYDMSLAQLGGPIADYFRGVNSVLTIDKTGAYGGFPAINSLFEAGLITYGWQTLAWSSGQWDPRAQIQQYNTGSNMVGGVPCDLNRSMADDFGQW